MCTQEYLFNQWTVSKQASGVLLERQKAIQNRGDWSRVTCSVKVAITAMGVGWKRTALNPDRGHRPASKCQVTTASSCGQHSPCTQLWFLYRKHPPPKKTNKQACYLITAATSSPENLMILQSGGEKNKLGRKSRQIPLPLVLSAQSGIE